MLAKEEIVATSKPTRTSGLLGRRRNGEWQSFNHHNVALVHTVAHEMRTPLTVIRAYSEAVLARKVRLNIREARDVMRRIEASAKLLEIIVEDMETLTELGAVRMRPAEVDVASFVSEAAIDLQALIPGRELEVSVQPLRVHTDPDRLRQVLNNLVQNAHKYSRPSGRIRVHVERSQDEGLIAVQDEGPGVPTGEIEQIFEPFYRGESATACQGRGLGLAICKRLIEAQGGRLRAARMPRGHFQFLISLPAAS